MNIIPCCYFPTSIVLVDDDVDLLSNMKRKISNMKSVSLVNTFSDPLAAVDYFNHISRNFLRPYLINLPTAVDYATGTMLENVYFYDFKKAFELIQNPKRKEISSVLVVDYDMPKVDGIEFCKKMKEQLIKKLMLTGVADHKLAVRAFNDGIIDHFIQKSPESTEQLETIIVDLQNKFFESITNEIFSGFVAKDDCCLKDQKFIKYFYDLCEKLKIQEHYLLDANGSMLLVDENDQRHALVVINDAIFDGYYEIALDNDAPENIKNALEQRIAFPCFMSEEEHHTVVSEWGEYMCNAEKINGDSEYYCALLHNL